MPLFGERLRAERERLGLGQQELAEKCGVTMRSQRNYEKDERQPDATYLAALTALGGDVLYVLTGTRSPMMTDRSYVAMSQHMANLGDSVTQGEAGLPPDEQLVLEAYRSLNPAARKELLAELLTGRKKPKAKPKAAEEGGIKVSGSGHRVAGRDFNERKE